MTTTRRSMPHPAADHRAARPHAALAALAGFDPGLARQYEKILSGATALDGLTRD